MLSDIASLDPTETRLASLLANTLANLKQKTNQQMKQIRYNDNRADNALFAINEYGEDPNDPKSNSVDLLADLMHLCSREDWNFEDLVRTAKMHFEHET